MRNKYEGNTDPVLTNAAIAYSNEAYIADQIFPVVPVMKQTGKHYIFNRERFSYMDTRRAAGANSKEVTLTLTTGNPYYCEDHALKQFVTDEDRDNAPAGMDPYVDATENVRERLLVAREKELATMLTDTAQLTQNATLSGTDQWSDYDNSDPLDDIETAAQTVQAAIGFRPNIAIMGQQVWDKLKYHPVLLELFKYTKGGQVTMEQLAALMGVERVLLGKAFYQTADEGQTEATSFIWGKHTILAYVAPRVAPKIMTLGINYLWQGKTLQVKRMRGVDEDDREGTYVRVGGWYYDENIVSASAGYLLKNVVA